MMKQPIRSAGFYSNDIFVEYISYVNSALDYKKISKKGFYQMLFIVSGEYEIEADNNTYIANSGAVIISNFESSFSFKRKSLNAERIEMYFHPSVFQEDFREEMLDIFKKLPDGSCYYPQNFENPVCFEVLKTIKNCLILHLNKYYLLTKIQTIIAELGYNCDEKLKLNKYDEKNIEVALVEYVRNNFSSNISYKTLNEKFFISDATINKYFRKLTGKPFRRFLNEARLNNAKNIIEYEYNNLNLREVSELCGYKTYSTFYREYCKKYGVAPTLNQN